MAPPAGCGARASRWRLRACNLRPSLLAGPPAPAPTSRGTEKLIISDTNLSRGCWSLAAPPCVRTGGGGPGKPWQPITTPCNPPAPSFAEPTRPGRPSPQYRKLKDLAMIALASLRMREPQKGREREGYIVCKSGLPRRPRDKSALYDFNCLAREERAPPLDRGRTSFLRRGCI